MSQTFHKFFNISAYVFIANGFYWLLSQNNTITKWFNQWLALIGKLHFCIHFVMMFIAGMVIYNLMASTNCYPKNHGLTAPEHLKIYKLSNALVAGIISVILWAAVLRLPVNSIATTLVNTFVTMAGFCFGSWAFVRMMFEPNKNNEQSAESSQPIATSAEDKYDGIHTATEIYQSISKKSKHINLYGSYGSGKSSVLNMVKEKLYGADESKQWLVVKFNAWGRLTDDVTIQSMLLDEITIALAGICQTTNLRGLPQHYLNALGALNKPSKAFSHLLANNSTTGDLLAKLQLHLAYYNIHLCIFIEDADRNKDAHDKLNELAPVLDKFKLLDNVYVLIALGYDENLSPILQRITQDRFDMLQISFKPQLTALITKYQNDTKTVQFRTEYAQFKELRSRQHVAPIFQSTGFTILDSESEGNVFGDILSNLSAIISTPRQYNIVEQELARLWNDLEGHFDFDCLLILIVLKTCESAAYDFVVKNRALLKGSLTKDDTRLKTRWEAFDARHKINFVRESSTLVRYLFPNTSNIQQQSFGLIQSISYNSSYKDYWPLYLQPSIVKDARHINDQELLNKITLIDPSTKLSNLQEDPLNNEKQDFIATVQTTQGMAYHLNNLAHCLTENKNIKFDTQLFNDLFFKAYTAYFKDSGMNKYDRHINTLKNCYQLARDFIDEEAQQKFFTEVIKESLVNDLYFIHKRRNSHDEFKSDQITLALSKHIDSPIIKQQLISQNERYRGLLFNLLGFYSAKPIEPKQNRLQHKIYTWLIEIGNSLPLESSDTVNRSIYFFDMVHYSDGHSYCINDEIINQPAFETDMMKQILEWATDFADKDNKQTRTQKLIKLIEKREKEAQNLT